MDNKRKISYKRASFVKVLEDDFTKRLPIPPAFTDIFEESIPPWLILEIAGTRKCWRVDIEKDGNGGLYLSCGFDCFVNAHSLEVGSFLLFELKEPPILQVKIYEKDGSEKTLGKTFESDYEAGVFDSPRSTPIIHQEGEVSPWLPTTPSVQHSAYEKQKNVSDGNKRKKCIVSATERGLCFSLNWRKANHFIYYLTIPKAMVSGKILSNKEAVTLQDKEGKRWPVELRLRPDGRVDFAQGWREFVNDNELRTGDRLTFEFVSNNLIQVHVGRAFQVDNPAQTEQDWEIGPPESFDMAYEIEELAANCAINIDAPVTGSDFERVVLGLKSSSFSLTWTPRTRNSYLHIPKAIANNQKLKNKDIVVLCDPKGKQWLMEVRTRPSDGRVGLGRGWSEFSSTYGIEAGDTLIFEFVTDRTMKVNITKAGGLDHAVTGNVVKQEVLKLL